MSETSLSISQRWQMGAEARALVILTGVMLAFGLATVYSASAIVEMEAGYGHAYLLLRQLSGIAIGIVLFAIAAKLDAEIWSRWAWPVMILSLVLLTIVILPFTASIAPRVHGARRYIFGTSIQPSELAKLAVVVWTSMLVVKKGETLRRLTKVRRARRSAHPADLREDRTTELRAVADVSVLRSRQGA